MIEITVKQLLESRPAFQKIGSASLKPEDFMLSYKLSHIKLALGNLDGPESPHEVALRELGKKHGREIGEGQDKQMILPPENAAAYLADQQTVYEQPLGVACKRLTLGEMEKVFAASPLTPNEMAGIMWLIDDEDSSL